jgi:hypothetical protein
MCDVAEIEGNKDGIFIITTPLIPLQRGNILRNYS